MPIKHRKTEECVCPRCLKDNTVVDNYDFDWNCMIRKMFCEDCGYMWKEYFTMAYDGFTDETGEYDANGVSADESPYKEN